MKKNQIKISTFPKISKKMKKDEDTENTGGTYIERTALGFQISVLHHSHLGDSFVKKIITSICRSQPLKHFCKGSDVRHSYYRCEPKPNGIIIDQTKCIKANVISKY